MKKLFLTVFGAFFVSVLAFSQIVTASSYFNDVSDFYAGLYTYSCNISVDADGKKMAGYALHGRPQILRINFSSPRGQVVMFDGSLLQIYLPEQRTVLQQSVSLATSDNDDISPRGLTLFRRYYTIAFETSADPVPLDEGSGTMVVNLLLTRRAPSEAFETIRISVDSESKLIRRVIATTPLGKVYRFDLTNYHLNVRLTDNDLMYDPPASVNAYNNFLFQE